MYINFKSKYKKIFWLILGFLIACLFINNVYAYPMPNGYEINEETIQDLWDTYIADKTPHDLNNSCPISNSLCNHTYSESDTPFNFVYVGYAGGTNVIFFARFQEEIVFDDTGGAGISGFNFNSTIKQFSNDFTDIKYNNYPYLAISNNNTVSTYYYNSSNTIYFYNSAGVDNYSSLGTYSHFALNFNLVRNDNLLKEANFIYPSTGPSYLNGYKKITLTPDDRYYMFSGLSTGSVYIPLDDFLTSGGRLSYYDIDLTSQPYTSYIQDYTITPDGLYARQDFDLSSYYGSDFVMFSKYIYLEYEDTTYYDIWVPNNIYDSPVTITPNSSGGNSFDFDYKDSNGNIQNEQFNSIDLTPPQPLLSDVFTNFTTEYYGLSSIVLAPISFLESVNSATCTPLTVPSPIGSTSFSLPCMTPIYETYGGDLFTLYQTITTGFIAYYVGLGYFNLIKGLKDPSDDRIEVIHL